MSSIAVENVQKLGYEAISHEAIRDAVAALDAARATADEAKKTHVQLEQELPNAQQQDAAADERLRAEGKPKLKGRPATQAAEKGIADAEHERRVCELAVDRARSELAAALDEHGAAWTAEVDADVQTMTVEWQNTVEGLSALHSRFVESLRIARVVGIGVGPRIGTVPFERRAIENVEFAAGQPKMPAYIAMGEVLAALIGVVEPEPPEPEPVEHPPLKGVNPLHGRRDVEREIAERREFAERASSPEGIEAREEARRQRNEQFHQQNDQALAESLRD